MNYIYNRAGRILGAFVLAYAIMTAGVYVYNSTQDATVNEKEDVRQ